MQTIVMAVFMSISEIMIEVLGIIAQLWLTYHII